MIPHFYVFINGVATLNQTRLIDALIEAKFPPNVDAVHGLNYAWLSTNFKELPHRMVCWQGDVLQAFTLDDLDERMYYGPTFIIYYDITEKVSDHDWMLVMREMEKIFHPDIKSPQIITRRLTTLLETPTEAKSNETSEFKMAIEDPKEYDFQYFMIEDRNICLAQVSKPFVDLPYTLVIRDFKNRGLKPLFSGLFISNTWGVSRYDIAFLNKLWNYLMLEPAFDMDLILKEATEACYPSLKGMPEPEPEMYRKTIDEVRIILQMKEEGTFFKNKNKLY